MREERRGANCAIPDSPVDFVQKGLLLPATGPLPADRRVRRTRQALQDALHALLPERGWDGICVQDLCTRANVGRSTFYLHFQSKEELLASGLDQLRAALLQRTTTAANTAPGSFRFMRGLIGLVHEQRRLFRSIVGRRGNRAVRMRFRDLMVQLANEDISPLAAPGWRRDAGARYSAGALAELLAWWLEAGKRQTAEDIERFFILLTEPVVAQLQRSAD
jgi:AcrR family transcriptional regulator